MTSAQFGPYRLDARLGGGPSAVVHRARDTSHGDRVVALKLFAPHLSNDPDFLLRFRRDAGRLSALREPHVAPIHSYGVLDGVAYLDMRLVRGESLDAAVRRGPIGPARALAVTEQIESAIASLRRGGLAQVPVDRRDVLLTGTPGRGEFVQLVGLALGRPTSAATAGPADGWVPAAGAAVAMRPRRRLLIAAWCAVAVVAALIATGVVARTSATVTSSVAETPLPPADASGLLATIKDTAGGPVAADIGALGGRPVLVASAEDGSIHTWDLGTGKQARPAIPGTATGLAVATIDGRQVAVVRHDTALAMYDLDTGAERPAPAAAGPVADGALTTVPGGGPPRMIVSQDSGVVLPNTGGKHQLGIRLIMLPSGAPAGPLLTIEGKSLYTSAVTQIDGRDVAVIAEANGSVRARDLVTGEVVGVPTPPQPTTVLNVATGTRDGTPIAVTSGVDNAVRIWNLRTGEQVGAPLVGHTSAVTLLNVVPVGNRTVLVSSSFGFVTPDKAETRFWDLDTGAPLGHPLVAHPSNITWRTAAVAGRSVLVGRSVDTTDFTIWDLAVLAGLEQK